MKRTYVRRSAPVLIALALSVFAAALSLRVVPASAAGAYMVFSPESVKNGQSFTITVTGAPASVTPKLWVDNNDGKGFLDFGAWVATDSAGKISVTRSLNCNAYSTLDPKVSSLAIGNRPLTQKMYLEFPDGSRTAETSHTKDCRVERASAAACPSVLGYFSDNAPPTPAYVNTHSLYLYAGDSYSGDWDSRSMMTDPGGMLPSNLLPVKITALDPLPAGVTGIEERDVTYAKEVTSYAAPGLSSKGPWARLYAAGRPTVIGETRVRIKADYKNGQTSCSETGFVNFRVTQKPAKYVPPTPPPIDTAPSAGGKMRFLKEAVKPVQRDPNGSVNLHNILAIKDNFVISGDCGNRGEGLWSIKETGAVTATRNPCQDAMHGSWGDLYGHGHLASQILLDWGSPEGNFIHGITPTGNAWVCLRRGPSGEPGDCEESYPGVFRRAVYYAFGSQDNIEPLSVSPEPDGPITYHYGLTVLNNTVLTKEGKLLGLPDWNNMGSGTIRENDAIGFGNFAVQKYGRSDKDGGWKVYRVAANGTRTLLKTLPVKYSALPNFDNSVWPPRMTFLEYGPAKVYVYRATPNDMVLDKTMEMAAGFPSVGDMAYGNKYAVWGDYVVVVATPSTGESYRSAGGAIVGLRNTDLQLWKNGQKVDELKAIADPFGGSLTMLAISENGYLATIATKTNAVRIYKLELERSPSLSEGELPTGTTTLPTGPSSTSPIATPPPINSTNQCYNTYRSLCDPSNELNKALCKLNPSFPFCKP